MNSYMPYIALCNMDEKRRFVSSLSIEYMSVHHVRSLHVLQLNVSDMYINFPRHACVQQSSPCLTAEKGIFQHLSNGS